MKFSSRVLLLVVILSIFPMVAVSWQSQEYKFSFDTPNSGWSDKGAARVGLPKSGVVEFASTNGSHFTVACYSYRSDEDAVNLVYGAYNTLETTQSMIQALSGSVRVIGKEGFCVVNGVGGYKREISYAHNGRVYFAVLVVLAKNNMHYSLVYSWRGERYHAGFLEFKEIKDTFRISE